MSSSYAVVERRFKRYEFVCVTHLKNFVEEMSPQKKFSFLKSGFPMKLEE